MNSVEPRGVPSPKGVFSRMWSTFKSWPVGWKVVSICLLAILVYGASQQSSQSASGPGTSSNGGSGSDYRAQAIAQLQAKHDRLQAWAWQCKQDMDAAAAQNPIRAMNGQMPLEAPCNNAMYQVAAQMALIETQIARLQGTEGDVCSITGYCPPAGGSASSSAEGDDGTGAVERYSREGILGQCIYRSDDGYQKQLPCDGGDTYWENIERGGFVAGASAPNGGSDYRRYSYSPQ